MRKAVLQVAPVVDTKVMCSHRVQLSALPVCIEIHSPRADHPGSLHSRSLCTAVYVHIRQRRYPTPGEVRPLQGSFSMTAHYVLSTSGSER